MIYLDHNATTYIHPDVRDLISGLALEALNPSSLHTPGRKAKAIMEEARNSVAAMLRAPLLGNNYKKGSEDGQDYNIVFTSSGTEANNLVINTHIDLDAEIFVSPVEHSSVLKPSGINNKETYLKLDQLGLVDLNHFEEILRTSSASASTGANTRLVSVMLANNETGIISPIKEIVSIARKYGALVHSDIVQAPGKMHINLQELDLDYATISGHKFGGMAGAGAIIYKSNLPLRPHILGGGQERGIRSGTEGVVQIAAMGRAASIISDEQGLGIRLNHMLSLKKYLEDAIEDKLPGSLVIGRNSPRLPNTSLIMTPGNKTEAHLIALDLRGIYVSSGSACSSGKLGQSNTLKAMQIEGYEKASIIRVSTSYNTTKADIDGFIEAFVDINKNT